MSKAVLALVAVVVVLAAAGYWWLNRPLGPYHQDNSGLYPIKVDGKYGYMDRTGKTVIPPQFDEIGGFSEGLAPVQIGTKVGYIDTTGTIVITPQFDAQDGRINGGPQLLVRQFRYGRALVVLGGLSGFIDKDGKYVHNPDLRSANWFWGEMAVVTTAAGEAAFVDRSGKVVMAAKFGKLGAFSDGLAPAATGGRWGFINRTGEWIINPQFEEARSFADGLAPVQVGGRWGYVNEKGKFIVNPQYGLGNEFSEGYARVYSGDRFSFIDTKGGVIGEAKFTAAGDFSEGLAPVKTDEGWGYINPTGKIVVAPQFDGAEAFQNGLALVRVVDKEAYVTTAGAFVVDPFPGTTVKAVKERIAKERMAAKVVSILTMGNLFDYNGRKMGEWQPLLDMLKDGNATITEASSSTNPADYDVVFWDSCRADNSLLFPRIRNLIGNGKVIVLTGTNSCSAGKYGSQIANEILRDFGMELTMDDPGNVIAYPAGKHSIMDGVGSFLAFRSPYVKITDESNVVPLAMNGKDVLLAVYEDRVSKGLLVASGLGEGFLFGEYDRSSKVYDHKCLLIMRNIISYARSLSARK